MQKRRVPLWFGAVLVTEPHVAIQTRLKEELAERQQSARSTSKSTQNRSSFNTSTPDRGLDEEEDDLEAAERRPSVSANGEPQGAAVSQKGDGVSHSVKGDGVSLNSRVSRFNTVRFAADPFFSFSSISDITLRRAHFGPSDRFAVLFGFVPLAVGTVLLASGMCAWGLADIVLGWPRESRWGWDGVSQLLYGFFKCIFGSLMMAGALTRSVLLLYLATVFFQVFVASLCISLVTSWATWLIAFAGINQPRWRPTWKDGINDMVSETLIALLCLFFSYGWFYGMLSSVRAVVVAGGTGFEKLTWFELMAQQADIMGYISNILVSKHPTQEKGWLQRFTQQRRNQRPDSRLLSTVQFLANSEEEEHTASEDERDRVDAPHHELTVFTRTSGDDASWTTTLDSPL
eukprot:Gregarina_sp_Pseudo_9__986@NODE_1634_length_1437_cov_7_061516_g1514_i0_p1_GENE_NODE_1634_length_1437_cov_7_061516_g1514_i0NODE_1634_length_1437_cov_7_061516_g1514_i0_p1_ORF_typecomplete_len403_score120_25DUF4395/PF14340_6/4_5DUF4395/PF14340_6/1_5_NODE_1634_length_1437_cov_7_061516_g1514_i0571265